MPQPGQKTITISGKILKRLEEIYNIEKKKKPRLSFSSFISESAIVELERQQIIRESFFISLISLNDDTIILKDLRKTHRLIEVQIKNGILKCLNDDSFECIHVGFVSALPEVRKALNK